MGGTGVTRGDDTVEETVGKGGKIPSVAEEEQDVDAIGK